MSIDVKKFAEFYGHMDWEGGLEGIVRHGHDGSGDAKLDTLLEKLEVLLEQTDAHLQAIWATYRPEIEAAIEEEQT